MRNPRTCTHLDIFIAGVLVNPQIGQMEIVRLIHALLQENMNINNSELGPSMIILWIRED